MLAHQQAPPQRVSPAYRPDPYANKPQPAPPGPSAYAQPGRPDRYGPPPAPYGGQGDGRPPAMQAYGSPPPQNYGFGPPPPAQSRPPVQRPPATPAAPRNANDRDSLWRMFCAVDKNSTTATFCTVTAVASVIQAFTDCARDREFVRRGTANGSSQRRLDFV